MPATDIPVLSLLLLAFFLVNDCLANPVKTPERNYTSVKPPVTRMRILYVTGLSDDNYDYEEEDRKSTHSKQPLAPTEILNPQLCDYDACRDQQVPCSQLSAINGCLCPGVSGPQDPPKAPSLREVTQEGSQVVVTWCAPSSTVYSYRVWADGHEALVSDEQSRRAVLQGLEAGANVCVVAVNDAGSSSQSCVEYEPQEDDSLSLRAGVIGGGLGFLLLLCLAALLVWKFKSCRKSGSDTEGLGNPSYSSEGPL